MDVALICMYEAAFVLICSQILNVLGCELFLVAPIIAHLWSVVEADTEELCEWVDIVCQAFLTVVVIYLLLAYAIGQR